MPLYHLLTKLVSDGLGLLLLEDSGSRQQSMATRHGLCPVRLVTENIAGIGRYPEYVAPADCFIAPPQWLRSSKDRKRTKRASL